MKVYDRQVATAKGQLISKCLYEIIMDQNTNKNFDSFCPGPFKAEIIKNFRWYFGRKYDTQKTFWNKLTFKNKKKVNWVNSLQNCNTKLLLKDNLSTWDQPAQFSTAKTTLPIYCLQINLTISLKLCFFLESIWL